MICPRLGHSQPRSALRASIHASISLAAQPTRPGPSGTRLGNEPAFSKRRKCESEKGMSSLSFFFEIIESTFHPCQIGRDNAAPVVSMMSVERSSERL
jgi:hypothetical protein